MMPFVGTVFARLEELRLAKGLSIRGLYKRADVNPAQYYDLRNRTQSEGDPGIQRDTAEKLARALDTTPEYLMHGAGPAQVTKRDAKYPNREDAVRALRSLPNAPERAIAYVLRQKPQRDLSQLEWIQRIIDAAVGPSEQDD